MPDISMCADEACPSRERCYRFRAVPSEYRQAYGAFVRLNDAEQCEYFWPLTSTARVRPLDECAGG